MTAAIYNQPGGWGIPPYIWPAVLGVSVAIHVSVLVYGLPELSWHEDEQQTPPETEVVIESGSLEFEDVKAVETTVAETAVPEIASIRPPAEIPVPLNSSSSVLSANPAQSQVVAPVQPSIGQPAVIQPASVEAIKSSTVEVTEVQDVETEQVQSAPQQLVEAIDVKTVEPAHERPLVPVPVTTNSPVTSVAAEKSSAVQTVTSSLVVATTVEPATSLETSSQIVSPSNVPVSVGRVPTESEKVTVEELEVATAPTQGLTAVAPASIAGRPVSNDTSSNAVTPGTPETTPVQQVPTVQNVTSTQPVDGTLIAKARPDVSETTVLHEPGTVQAVKPLEQQIAAVQPAEVDLPALVPSEPDTSTVPATPLIGTPTHNVAPVEVASIDPLAKVTAYVANFDAGDCSHLTVMSAGTESAVVTAFGAGIASFVRFDRMFTETQGYEANIEVRLVTSRQCALLNAPGLAEGVEAAGLVDLDKTLVRSGTAVSGVIQRDLPLGRIAAAEEAGLELNGNGPPELYLIDDAGQIHDGRRHILPASNAVTAGGWRFSVPVTLISSQDQETALILAIWNRPKDNQPQRFGALPASRIADILDKPGVYSLTAFKVSR